MYLHTNVKPNLQNVAVFISTEQNGSYVIRQNNIKQRTLCVYYFLIKRKKLFGQPNIRTSISDKPVHSASNYRSKRTSRNLGFKKTRNSDRKKHFVLEDRGCRKYSIDEYEILIAMKRFFLRIRSFGNFLIDKYRKNMFFNVWFRELMNSGNFRSMDIERKIWDLTVFRKSFIDEYGNFDTG